MPDIDRIPSEEYCSEVLFMIKDFRSYIDMDPVASQTPMIDIEPVKLNEKLVEEISNHNTGDPFSESTSVGFVQSPENASTATAILLSGKNRTHDREAFTRLSTDGTAVTTMLKFCEFLHGAGKK